MGPFINLTTGRCNWLSQGGDTCGLVTVAMGSIWSVPWGLFLGCSWYFEGVLGPSRHLKWCIDKRWWQPICELIGELMKEEMPARWARPLPGGESAPPPSHLCQAESSSWGAACTLLSVLGCLAAATPGCQWQESVCNTLLSLPLFFQRIPNTFLQQLKISLLCNSKVETETDRKSRRGSKLKPQRFRINKSS